MTQIDERELERGHRKARSFVHGLITLSLLLVALAFAGVRFNPPQSWLDPNLYRAIWIVVLFLGLGAVVLRRVRSNAARLQDVAGVFGQSALVASLVKTTLFVAALGGLAALLGYAAYLLSGDPSDALKAGVVGVAVLLYCYPRRAAWRRVLEASQQPGGIPGPSPAKGTAP
jgi:FtsH-binding integral membrane protein